MVSYPKAPDDFMGGWESAVEEAANVTKDLLKSVGKDVINRPFGSKPVPFEDQMMEWSLAREDPEALIQMADDLGLSDESFIRYSIQQEKAFKRWNGTPSS